MTEHGKFHLGFSLCQRIFSTLVRQLDIQSIDILNSIEYLMTMNSLNLYFASVSLSVLLVVLSKPAMNEIFLVLLSYVIILTFLAIEISLFFATFPR